MKYRSALISLLLFKAYKKYKFIEQSRRVKAGLLEAKKNGKKLGRPKLIDTNIEEIKRLHDIGYSIRGIATLIGVSKSTVHQRLKLYKQTHEI